ncbi:hypothetical protein [Novosphingobium sp. BL-52-GroH]|uniref:hypothetical protein n=1 Tax=Novosphingobium sp. BL-52-GroH TaxID=3349877 RepID=UPI00384FE398
MADLEMHTWLRNYDPDLPLIDRINDPASSDVEIELAARSLHVGLDSGYYDAEALADAIAALWAEIDAGIMSDTSDARAALRNLLGCGDPYTRALYDTVRHLEAEEAALHLHEHARMMMVRADTARLASKQREQIG